LFQAQLAARRLRRLRRLRRFANRAGRRHLSLAGTSHHADDIAAFELHEVNQIRLATPGDGKAFANIYRPAVEHSAASFELEAPDGAEMERRVERVIQRTPWLAFETHGQILGYAYAGKHRERPGYQWSVEVSAYVAAEAQRTGIGRALYTSLIAILIHQGFVNAYAGITLPNPGSLALHTAVGFAPVGVYAGIGYKHGAWHDVIWLERPLATRDTHPRPPITLPELSGTPEFGNAIASGMSLIQARYA
jgi:phosphinothricin acetyltransferase